MKKILSLISLPSMLLILSPAFSESEINASTKIMPYIADIKYAESKNYINSKSLKSAFIDLGWVYYKWNGLEGNKSPVAITNGFYRYGGGGDASAIDTCNAIQTLRKQTGINTDFTYEYHGVKAGLATYNATDTAKVVSLTVDAVEQCNQAALAQGIQSSPIVGISFDFEGQPSEGNDLRYWRQLSAYAIAKGGYSLSNFAFSDAFNFASVVAMGPLGFAVPSLYDVGKKRWIPNDGKLPAQGSIGNKILNASIPQLASIYKQDKNCDDSHGPRSYCNINTQDTEESVNERMFGSGNGLKDLYTNLTFTIPEAWKGAGFHVLWGMPWSATAMNWSSLEMQVNTNPADKVKYGNTLSSQIMLRCSAFYGDKLGRCDTDPAYKDGYSKLALNEFISQRAGVLNWYQADGKPFSSATLFGQNCQNSAIKGDNSECIEIPGNPSSLGQLSNLTVSSLASFVQRQNLVDQLRSANNPWQILQYHQITMLVLLDQYMYDMAKQNGMSKLILGNALYALESSPNKCVDSKDAQGVCFMPEPYYIGWNVKYPTGETESHFYDKEKALLWAVVPALYYSKGNE